MMHEDDDNEKDFDDLFELTPVQPKEITVYDAPIEDGDAYDIEAARQNIHHLLQKGTVALDELISLARSTNNVAAFETVAKLLKNMADINKDLIVVQEKKKQLKIADDVKNDEPKKVINHNNLFVGTTEDFAKIMEEKSKYNK